ncbi:MAG: phosphoribosylamine--glycine ligase, partial [spirochete symbiont of Stewartia floridana]
MGFMNRKNVLVVGSGGREHAIAWSLARSLQTAHVFVAPGNAGTQWSANANPVGLQPRASSSNVPISADDFSALIKFAAANDIALTVIGPEIPLAQGIVDLFKKNSLPVFGPTQEAARLEASKQFAKDFMRREAIPTADYCYFHRIEDALKYLQSAKGPLVVKASGLAAGKGVILCENPDEAREAIRVIMAERVFGHAGDCVVIEERLTGQEMSLLAFSDGHTIVPMPPARDHKRIFDQDRGPNTGGMGVFTHPPDVDTGDVDEIIRTVLQPAITAMADRGK